jgi:alginate O-acetyltransferase complex protein AlgI
VALTILSPLWLLAMFTTVGCYWLLSAKLRGHFLIVATAALLAFADLRSLALLSAYVLYTWLAMEKRFRWATASCLAGPVLILAWFKLQVNNNPLDTLQDLAVPLGMSYFTFRVLHYVIERSRNNLPEHNFGDYLAYLFFMPTVLIGPIHRFPQFQSDRRQLDWQAGHISGGLERILVGYFKVTVLGNFVLSSIAGGYVERAYSHSVSLGYYLEAVLGSLNLYVQFSGFSDVAIGFALMLGYRVMENFNHPFLQKNIADFWRCWHISLTSWAREYIFMTVLSLSRNPYLATLASLLCIGLWHDVSMQYVNWGLYHGIGIIVCMQWGKYYRKWRLPSPRRPLARAGVDLFKILLTANYFFMGYIILKEDSLLDAVRVIAIIIIPGLH